MAKTRPISHFQLPPREVDRSLGTLSTEDYANLSASLQKRGEMRLVEGDLSGVKYFEQALELDPANPTLFYEQGLAFFEYGALEKNDKVLGLACRRFKMATKLNPTYCEAWHAWGNTLAFLGKKTGRESYFLSAKKKFDQAMTHMKGDVVGDFLYDLGHLLLQLAKRSGEVTDYKEALDIYERVSEFQKEQSAEFWLEYGQAALALGRYLSDTASFAQAATCFKQALSEAIASSKGWAALARAMSELANHTHEDEHYTQASECFGTASRLDPSDAALYLEWATLLYNGGKWLDDCKRLSSGIEKCRIAHRLKRHDMGIVAMWSQTLALLGLKSDRLDMMRKAEDKVDHAIARNENIPELWGAHGNVCLCLAQYYNDLDGYYQAIDKFQQGVSLDRSRFELWFGLGTATYHAALLESEPKVYARAARFFKRALDLHISAATHFFYGNAIGNPEADEYSFPIAIEHMERAIAMQPNVAYSHPDWMFRYGCALDTHASNEETESHHIKAIEALTQVLHIAPDYPEIHYHLGLAYAHYGDLVTDKDLINTALHHFRIAYTQEKESDHVILDWATTLINFADLFPDGQDSDHSLREAEYKLIQAAKLGNTHAYYILACLFSILHQYDRAIYFLEKAHAFDALPSIEELVNDDWLEGIQDHEGFRLFLDQIPKV